MMSTNEAMIMQIFSTNFSIFRTRAKKNLPEINLICSTWKSSFNINLIIVKVENDFNIEILLRPLNYWIFCIRLQLNCCALFTLPSLTCNCLSPHAHSTPPSSNFTLTAKPMLVSKESSKTMKLSRYDLIYM